MSLLAFFVERGLRVSVSFELGFKTKAVLIEQGALLVGGSVRELIGIDEGSCTLCRLTKMLQMGQFVALRRCLLIVPFVFLQIDFGVTCFGNFPFGVMQMFLARDELMPGVEGARCEVDACGISNFCYIVCIFKFVCGVLG